MKRFEYLAPASIEAATQMLAEHGGECQLIAGGTDLMIDCRYDRKSPHFVVDIMKIPSLAVISMDGKLRIGATTPLNEVDRSNQIRSTIRMLSESAALVGSQQIRNLATLGGNICNAVPSADTAPPLLAADAALSIAGPRGIRNVPINEFFIGPRRNILEDDEIVVEFIIEPSRPLSGSTYRRHTTRVALDLAKVGVAVYVALDPQTEAIDFARIALGAVAPTPVRATEAEEFLQGKNPTKEVFEEAARLSMKAASPITDVRSTEAHRREIVGVLTRRCLEEAILRARTTGGD